MLGIDHLGLFVVAGLLLNLTPGPDVLYILAHGVKGGARQGAVAALGIVAGCFVHIAAATLGLSALMAASATAFTVLKWLGAAYLLWLGWAMLRSNKSVSMPAADGSPSGVTGPTDWKKVFANGFWTNVLNPKVALFFLAFLPQFISADAPHKTLAFLALGLLFNLNSLWVNLGFAWLAAAVGAAWRSAQAGAASPRWRSVQGAAQWLERLAGILFIAFGLRLALMENPAG